MIVRRRSHNIRNQNRRKYTTRRTRPHSRHVSLFYRHGKQVCARESRKEAEATFERTTGRCLEKRSSFCEPAKVHFAAGCKIAARPLRGHGHNAGFPCPSKTGEPRPPSVVAISKRKQMQCRGCRSHAHAVDTLKARGEEAGDVKAVTSLMMCQQPPRWRPC